MICKNFLLEGEQGEKAACFFSVLRLLVEQIFSVLMMGVF